MKEESPKLRAALAGVAECGRKDGDWAMRVRRETKLWRANAREIRRKGGLMGMMI
jgi:hypothetical protein